MTDRPILFSGPMVRAIIGGRKTQTRRVLKPQPVAGQSIYKWKIPYGIDDRLWVREHWRTVNAYDDLAPSDMGGEEPLRFEADGSWQAYGFKVDGPLGRHRQGMHMPRWASRLTLTITAVGVHRLQEISDEDAKAEGVCICKDFSTDDRTEWWVPGETNVFPDYPRLAFWDLWDSLNAKRGFGWEENPWVAAITFETHRRNIDQVPE